MQCIQKWRMEILPSSMSQESRDREGQNERIFHWDCLLKLLVIIALHHMCWLPKHTDDHSKSHSNRWILPSWFFSPFLSLVHGSQVIFAWMCCYLRRLATTVNVFPSIIFSLILLPLVLSTPNILMDEKDNFTSRPHWKYSKIHTHTVEWKMLEIVALFSALFTFFLSAFEFRPSSFGIFVNEQIIVKIYT